MAESKRLLPARPSLEQLQKQAKELLRDMRVADPTAKPTLADAQFALAREYGFESWARLKHYVESVIDPAMQQFEDLARRIADAYTTADVNAIREINWTNGTSFIWYREPEKMHRRLTTWFAATNRTSDMAVADARQLVARSYGFDDWAEFAQSVTPRPGRGSSISTFYKIDREQNAIWVRGPLSAQNWDTVCEVIVEEKITRLDAGGISDAGMARLARIPDLKYLQIGLSGDLTDDGVLHLAQMPQLEELEMGGPQSQITDRGLQALRNLSVLRKFHMAWAPRISDVGVSHLASCSNLESVDLMGTLTGDGAIRALGGQLRLRHFQTGRLVTDDGIPLLHELPCFKSAGEQNHLMLDGPFTDAGVRRLIGLEGLFSLSFFWHCTGLTAAGFEPLRHLPNLSSLAAETNRPIDDAMPHIAAIPRLRMLTAHDCGDAGFVAISHSTSLQCLGLGGSGLTGHGFAAIAKMPALQRLAVDCRNVDDAALSFLPKFPSLRELTSRGFQDSGFRHIGRCERLERLWCMYCPDTGDRATEYLANLSQLKMCYAGETQITDRSLEVLAGIASLECVELWGCASVTDLGVAQLTRLPQLREITLDGLARVTPAAAKLFPPHVRVTYFG